MKKLLLLSLLFMTLLTLGAEETRRKTTVGKDGEKITTVYYENDAAYRIKREYYGDGPVYRLMIDYFDPKSPDYIEKTENYMYMDTSPQFAIRVADLQIFYYRKGNPSEFTKMEVRIDEEGVRLTKVYYEPDNKKISCLYIQQLICKMLFCI